MSQGTVFPNFSGLREDLADVISIVDNKNCPVTSTARKGSDISNPGVFSWQADEYKEPSFDGVLTNADVATFEDASSSRALLSGRAQKFRRSIKVDDFTQISDVAGIGKNKAFAHSVSKSLVELKRDIESAVCSDRNSQEQAGVSPYRTRGLGSWISNAAQSSDLPVPEAFRTPSGSINTTATASLTESEVQAVLQSMYTVTGTMSSMMLVCGPELKRAFTNFTRFAGGADNKAGLSVRTFSQSAESKKIVASIDSFHGDFGVLDIVPSLFLAKDQASAVQLARGYVMSPEMIELRYGRRPRFQELEDMGGGKRALVDAIAALVCMNPKGLAKFAATS
jgi:hypothetical protein